MKFAYFLCISLQISLFSAFLFPASLRDLQSSNSSNNSNSSFIFISQETPSSRLSTSESSELNTWLSWKNDFTRYDSHFDAVPKVFAPERDYYESSVLVLGLPLYVIGGVILFIGLLFCIFRYGFGLCGGRRSNKNLAYISRFSRNCTFVVAGLGATLWFVGVIIAIVGTTKFNDSLKDTQDSLESEGALIEAQTEDFRSVANDINYENLTWANDSSETFTLPISSSYANILLEAQKINQRSQEFSDYMASDNRVFQGFLWFFFVFGLLMAGALVFAVVKQLGSLANILGIIYILLSAMAFGVSGFYFSQTFKVGDICEQNRNIIATNYPASGHGILWYMNRFSPSNEQVLFEERYQATRDLTLASDFYLEYLKAANATDVGEIQHQTDIIDRYNSQTYSSNGNLTLWGRIIKELDSTLRHINDLKDYDGLRRYSVVSESEYCHIGLPSLYLGFVGTLIEGIGFLFLLIAGIQLKEILEKLKSDKESMINIRQAGGYA